MSATFVVKYVRKLRDLRERRDDPDVQALKAAVRDDAELLDIVAEYDGPNTPDWTGEGDPPELCFGKDYAPIPRGPNYDSTQDDICGRNCPVGLFKTPDVMQDGEVQGNLGCLMLKIFADVFDIPLAPPECGKRRANFLRLQLMEAIPAIMDRATQPQPTTEPMSHQYVLQPNDEIHQGFVWSHTTGQFVQHPDGTPVLEAHVVQPAAPAAPPAPPAAPPMPAPPAAPAAPAAPQGVPTPPAAPMGAPPMPAAPAAPAVPTAPTAPPAAPAAPAAPTVPAAPTAPTAPAALAAPPVVEEEDDGEGIDVDAIGSVLDIMEQQAHASLQQIAQIREWLGLGESEGVAAPVASAPVAAAPTASAPQAAPASTGSQDFMQALAQKFAGWTKGAFKTHFTQSADEPTLVQWSQALGIDPNKYKPETRVKSMRTAIVGKVFGRKSDTPIL